MNICLFEKEEIKKPLSLRDERGQHIIKILHKKEGENFSAGIINGPAGTATITKIETEEVTTSDGKKTYIDGNIYFTFEEKTDGKKLYPLKMIIGFPRPIQLKRLLRDMAGLGVEEIHLTGTELGEKSYLKSDLAKPEECKKMLLDGTVQAASTHIPEIYMHENLEACLKSLNTQNSVCMMLDNVTPENNLWDYLMENDLNNKSCIAAIGSERGWTENEKNILKENGFVLLSMGKRVLRTETASTVAASLILGKMGVLD